MFSPIVRSKLYALLVDALVTVEFRYKYAKCDGSPGYNASTLSDDF